MDWTTSGSTPQSHSMALVPGITMAGKPPHLETLEAADEHFEHYLHMSSIVYLRGWHQTGHFVDWSSKGTLIRRVLPGIVKLFYDATSETSDEEHNTAWQMMVPSLFAPYTNELAALPEWRGKALPTSSRSTRVQLPDNTRACILWCNSISDDMKPDFNVECTTSLNHVSLSFETSPLLQAPRGAHFHEAGDYSASYEAMREAVSYAFDSYIERRKSKPRETIRTSYVARDAAAAISRFLTFVSTGTADDLFVYQPKLADHGDPLHPESDGDVVFKRSTGLDVIPHELQCSYKPVIDPRQTGWT